jgi:ribonuclease BN (tRNA processing enzyme)
VDYVNLSMTPSTDDGNTIVFSGDTGRIQEMDSFSKGADILVHDAGIGPVRTDTPTDSLVWTDYTEPMTEDKRDRLEAVHCNARQCGAITREADVETLVLTHLLPYRDTEAMLDVTGGVKLVSEAAEFLSVYGRNRPPHLRYRVDRLVVCGARADTQADH